MTMTDTEVKESILALLDSRKKLLWLLEQNPMNDEQRKHIEDGKELLKQANRLLDGFDFILPT